MDTRKIAELLRATIDPSQQQQAEEQLTQVHKIIGFAPSLLQVVMATDMDMPVRQAGVIYLKNMVTQNWQEREVEAGQPQVFHIHEQDRAMIRDAIVDAMVHAPDLVRVQLGVCVNHIVRYDFPGKWTQIVDKISIYLQSPDPNGWMGALLSLYQLVKNFEYKKVEERTPLTEAMNLLLPQVQQLLVRLLPDLSEQSVLLQKQILKLFYALTQYSLPMGLLTKPIFTQWMELARAIADRPVPEQTLSVDEDERPELPWWKCRKWAMHILVRVFERYGSPGNVNKEYKEFADWFLKTFSAGILEVMMRTLDQHRRKVYVSPRVLQQTLNYVNQAVGHAFSWKMLKPHSAAVIQEVLFPIMCYTDADEELWQCDPHEYIRTKFDIFEDYVSPVMAAQTLLHTICKKRKDQLQKTMEFLMQVLTAPNADPRQKDGALHMVGSLADILLKKPLYKSQMEQLLAQFVFPEFSSPHGHLRARACWVLQHFCNIKFNEETILAEAINLTQRSLLTDSELPVKVEAAVALQMLLSGQEEKAEKYVEPHIRPITLELLNIIRETENDELTTVMQKIVSTYTEQLMPVAVEICQHLVTTFGQVIGHDEESDERAITAMGLLNTIETLIAVMEDHEDVLTQLEPVALQVVGLIFTQSAMEFYEEALSLVFDLTSKKVSADLWKVLEMIYQVFEKDAFDYFTDMMPALHNYVTVDTEAFVSNPNYLLALFNMCKAILTGDSGEDAECHAAKLLEVILLQCKGRVDQCIPSFVELVLSRLTREVKTSELRTMCLQVIIAALYTSPNLVLETLKRLQAAMGDSSQSLTSHFIRQWIHDTDCFLGLHDRKLCVLGMCTLITAAPSHPGLVEECAQQIVPSLLLLFDGLKRAYAAKAAEEEENGNEDDEDDEDCEEVLSSDEDDIDHDGQDYLERLQEKITKASGQSPFPITTVIKDLPGDEDEEDGDDDEDEDDDEEETALEGYTTPLDVENCEIDEYIIFKQVLEEVQGTNPGWYNALTGALTSDQQKALNDVIVLADQRRAAAESKRIEEAGGYSFNQQTVPDSFNFGGNVSTSPFSR
ncbi:importin-7 [Daphnia magna]|uniref:Importin N-terminal domain-containing protein n=1 Tax=Daphnia magna TaxID=35525 RepID=A0ABQ9Z6T7_9CRUS|nr:importin-7 [Daphnia magna]KAK4008612.1 hypothetical protein OUZ56_013747 [Daphnia magna]